MLMLEHKGIPYEPVTIPTGFQRALPALGFPGGTVPALRSDGRRVQTNRAIARYLDEVEPEPPLLPSDPGRRAEVEEAERWADEEFQMVARRLGIAGIMRGGEVCPERGARGRLGTLLWHRPRSRAIGGRGVARYFNVTPETERRLLEELPSRLDRIDAWVEAGTLNGEEPNAADFAIAPSLALLLYRRDLEDEIRPRPAFGLVSRLLPG